MSLIWPEYLPLLLLAEDLAGAVGQVLDARRQAGAAVVAPQQRLPAERVDVAANRLRRHPELLGQGLDGDEAVAADQVEDLVVPGVLGVQGRLLRRGQHKPDRRGV